jgi:alpha-beta hydrolase superfamily lysophospholipase
MRTTKTQKLEFRNSGIILAIHGLGGRGAWFDNLKTALDEHGVELIAPDLKGFGNNEPRGHVESFNDWVSDIQAIYEKLKADKPDAQIVLMGHSMGAVVLSHIKVAADDKLIYSVPGFKGARATFKMSFTLTTLLKLFRDTFITHENSLIKLPSSQLTKHITDEDPLKVYEVSPNLLWQVLLMSQNLKSRFINILNPLLLIQVKNDLVVDNETMDKIFHEIPSAKKELNILENTEHDWIWDQEAVKIAVPIILDFIK